MLTLTLAAALLTDAHDARGLAALARACGFTGEPAPLDATARESLGLPSPIRAATVLEGRGVLRALCVVLPRGGLTRESIAGIAIRLQRRSPFALWFVCAAERSGESAALATAVLAPRPHASLLLVSRGRIVDSDSETVRAIAGAADGLDVLVHARWCELLGREALTQRFFRALESTVDRMATSVSAHASEDDARTLAILTSTRLLFLSFLESKGWLDGDHGFLRRTWDACMTDGGGYQRHVLDPLCFGTLNTQRSRRAAAARAFGQIPFLNGGLFSRTSLERRHRHARFSDEALGALVSDLLGRWRFTVRENDVSNAEAAVDPEMLGRAFECLMASRERRSTGSFYTPKALVERVFNAGLDSAVEDSIEPLHALRRGEAIPGEHAASLASRLAALRILDPACGSGAFLVHALEELASLRGRLDPLHSPDLLRRDILARQLFGVDRQPTAVWLCELRLWLAVVVETTAGDPQSVPPLPNLDAQVRIGDALSGDGFVDGPLTRRSVPLARLRERYARSTGVRKRTLARVLAAAERAAAVTATDARLSVVTASRRDVVAALRGRDLFGARVTADASMRARLDELRIDARGIRAERRSLGHGGAVAFDFAAQFADVGAAGGFDLVIGNPPWVRLHNIPPRERVRLRSHFITFREAGWKAGAIAAGAGSGFAAQVDLAALFVERSLSLLRPRGSLSLLVPAKLWRSLAGGGVRRLLSDSASVIELEDWSEARATFDAAVYPSLVVATRGVADGDTDVNMSEHHRDRALRWSVSRSALPLDNTPGAPWLWLPNDPRAGFDRVRALGVPLAEREAFRPRLGVKSGFNDAFIVHAGDDGWITARDGRRAMIEPRMLRPLLRGESVTPWSIGNIEERIVFPHDAGLRPLATLPPLAHRWLSHYRTRLTARTDYRAQTAWWSLYRTDAADHRAPRVVWADMSRTPRAAVLPTGSPMVPLNSCYVVPMPSLREAHALAAWLNSPLAAAWLAALAEPARGGFRRMLGWSVGLLPIPRDWERAVDLLAPYGMRAAHGDVPSTSELLDATLDALEIAPHEVEALLTWGHR